MRARRGGRPHAPGDRRRRRRRCTSTLVEPDPAALRPTLLASLRRGIERDYVGQVSRDVVRLLRADANPGEMVWEAVAHGAPRAEFGWGHSIASATDCLAMVDLYDGDQRALPIVQGIAGIAETERDRPVNPLPDPVAAGRPPAGDEFRRLVEAEQLEPAQALLRGAIHAGCDGRRAAAVVHRRRQRPPARATATGRSTPRRRSSSSTRSAGSGPTPCCRTSCRRSSTAPARTRCRTCARSRRALAGVDLAALAAVDPDPAWRDDGAAAAAILAGGRDRAAPLRAAVAALRDGAGVDGVLDVVVDAVAERMLRYDPAGEFDFHDDFGWLDITHGLTYANAARWHAGTPRPATSIAADTVRLALWCVFLAHWTGRHEWHTGVGEPVSRRPRHDRPRRRRRRRCSARALDDTTTAFIVHAHAVKTSRAATEEAVRAGLVRGRSRRRPGSSDAPKLERFVAATVTRSIDFLSGRARRD